MQELVYYLIGIALVIHTILFSILVYVVYKLFKGLMGIISRGDELIDEAKTSKSSLIFPLAITAFTLYRKLRKGVGSII